MLVLSGNERLKSGFLEGFFGSIRLIIESLNIMTGFDLLRPCLGVWLD